MSHRLKFRTLKNLLLTSLAHLGITSHASAENRVLFIGNSFTIGSGESVAEIFDALAIAGGHDDPITVMRADGGKDYQWHSGNAPTQTAITSRDWTHVILQNYSTEPTHITAGGVADHQTFGTLLYDQILANNSETQVILFETWSRAADHSLITGTSTPSSFASTAEMQSELRQNYQALATALNTNHPANPTVVVGPVGDAWENAGGLLASSHPDYVSLHGSDRYHGNDNGYFLAAAVFYATIYGVSPEGLHTKPAVAALNLSLTEDAELLERVAWQTVSQMGELAFFSQPADLTIEEGHPATFRASVRGADAYSAQWFKDGEKIEGATELTYIIPNAGLDLNGSVYTLKVTHGEDSITSEPATLTVQTDETPPTLEDTTLEDSTTLKLEFSEPIGLAPLQAFTVVHQGKRIPVTDVTASENETTFALSLASAITGRFVLNVSSDVTDSFGNPISNDTLFVSPGTSPFGERVLIDFGSSGTSTGPSEDSSQSWNNVSSVGVSDTGVISDLLSVSGLSTGIGLEMVRRFNGANSSGSTVAAKYPSSATRDSLFGNTSTFSGLANVFPAFQLTGLDPDETYQLTFYASRTGVSDNRETRYTVTGAATSETTLNPAGNVDRESTLEDLAPDSNGNLLIEISPTSANTNSNKFTYLGVLQISSPDATPPTLYQPVPLGDQIIIDWSGVAALETSSSLDGIWTPITPAPYPPHVEAMVASGARFFRLKY